MKKNFLLSCFIPIFLSIFMSIFSIPFYSLDSGNVVFSNFTSNFCWPTRGYTKITSKFGYRNAPTKGAGTYHGGIDIGAPEGSNICSIDDGIIKYVGWLGATGYTVVISHTNGVISTYGHVSDNFIVHVDESVKKGQIIAQVGPKYVEGKSYTTYTDSGGRYTNGATTGPHLHLAISVNGKKVDPQDFF